jgi:hypothetical protein
MPKFWFHPEARHEMIYKLLLLGNTKWLNKFCNVTPIVQNGILLVATRLGIEDPLYNTDHTTELGLLFDLDDG